MLLEVNNLEVRYGTVPAVRDITFEVAAGMASARPIETAGAAPGALPRLLESVRPGDYIAILAFLQPRPGCTPAAGRR